MKRKMGAPFLTAGVIIAAAAIVYAHCQIPCGIFDDPARFTEMREHIATIEKSMDQITLLSNSAKPDMNQIVRWVSNKDHHADELGGIITYYFMAQRLAPVDAKADPGYVRKLTLLHRMLVEALKAKQTTDPAHVKNLLMLTDEFEAAYSGKKQ